MSHVPAEPSSDRAGRDRQAEVHVPFVTAALAFGVLGGFSLAFPLSMEALLVGLSASWASHAQVHGHLQVLGFAGLCVLYASAPLPDYTTIPLAFAFLIAYLSVTTSPITAALSNPVLVYLGEISYSTYMVHYQIGRAHV